MYITCDVPQSMCMQELAHQRHPVPVPVPVPVPLIPHAWVDAGGAAAALATMAMVDRLLTTVVVDEPRREGLPPSMVDNTVSSLMVNVPSLARHIIVVFDGAQHGIDQQRGTRALGCEHEIDEAAHATYKQVAIARIQKRTEGSGSDVSFLQMPMRCCFPILIRAGIARAMTSFVAVIMSDSPVQKPFDVSTLLELMHSHGHIQKVLFSIGRNGCYLKNAWRVCHTHRRMGSPSNATLVNGKLALTPTHRWFDRHNHVATVSHYRQLGQQFGYGYGASPPERLLCDAWGNHSKWGMYLLGDEEDGDYSGLAQESRRTLPCAPQASCRVDGAHTRKLRALFDRPDGFASCAVVGNSGMMLQSPDLGRQIDAHEFVVRSNIAPVSGYTAFVGSVTSLRVMNSEALGCATLERACPRQRRGDRSWCPPYAIFFNSAEPFAAALARACGNRTGPTLGWADLDRRADATLRRFRVSGRNNTAKNVMTGIYAIAVAMHLCPNGATLFGFSSGDSPAADSAYHYYDNNKVRNRTDNIGRASRRLSHMAREEPQCLRFHRKTGARGHQQSLPNGAQGKGVARQSQAPRAIAKERVDPFVDQLRHTYWPSAYYFDMPENFLGQPLDSCPRLALLPEWASRRSSAYTRNFLAYRGLYQNMDDADAVLPMPGPPEVQLCDDEVASSAGAAWRQSLADAPAVVLSYTARQFQRPWPLGISAALHDLPLVVVGQLPETALDDEISAEEAAALKLPSLLRGIQMLASLNQTASKPVLL